MSYEKWQTYVNLIENNGMILPKYVWASQADFITKCKNIKRKLHKYISNIYFNNV